MSLCVSQMSPLFEIYQSQVLGSVEKLMKGQSLLEGIKLNQVDEIHNMAYIYYKNRRYWEAEAQFRLLVAIEPKNSGFWKGLGACLQMRKSYQEALNCYTCAQAIILDDPDPYIEIHCADCYFALNQIEKGLKVLEGARACAKNRNDKKVINHVNFIRSRWIKSKKSTNKKSSHVDRKVFSDK